MECCLVCCAQNQRILFEVCNLFLLIKSFYQYNTSLLYRLLFLLSYPFTNFPKYMHINIDSIIESALLITSHTTRYDQQFFWFTLCRVVWLHSSGSGSLTKSVQFSSNILLTMQHGVNWLSCIRLELYLSCTELLILIHQFLSISNLLSEHFTSFGHSLDQERTKLSPLQFYSHRSIM